VPIVLVADDDPDHRELLALALAKDGYEVVTASGAAAARDVLRGRKVDAALIDVRMPGEDGIALCRSLRSDPPTVVLPIMLISADVNDHRVVAALQAGADDYVTKPFHRTELCARVGNLLLLRRIRPAIAATRAASYAAATMGERPETRTEQGRRTA
jgi:DNA-binding response OmpR family regulator